MGDDLDLIVGDQGRRMTAVLNCVDPHVTIPAHHVPENGLGEQIRLLPANHQNGDVDRIPVFPAVDAVMPGVSKCMGNIRIAERLEAASLRAPRDTMPCQVPPVCILKLPEGRQNPSVVDFGLFDRLEGLWRIVEICAEPKQSGPRQIRSDLVDDDATDRAARKRRQNV